MKSNSKEILLSGLFFIATIFTLNFALEQIQSTTLLKDSESGKVTKIEFEKINFAKIDSNGIKTRKLFSESDCIILYVVEDLNCFSCNNDIMDYIELSKSLSINFQHLIIYSGLDTNKVKRNFLLSGLKNNSSLLIDIEIVKEFSLSKASLYFYDRKNENVIYSTWISKDITQIGKKEQIFQKVIKLLVPTHNSN